MPTPAVYAHLPTGRQGPYAGLWAAERIAELLKNETYLGNMVQGRSVKTSYINPKVPEAAAGKVGGGGGTHEPLVDVETFRKVQNAHGQPQTYPQPHL